MQPIYLICDYREQFESLIEGEKIYNDHLSKKSLFHLMDTIKCLGFDVTYFGGVDKLIECYHNKINMPNGLYINLNDGLNDKHKRGQTPMLLEMLKVQYSGPDPFHALLASDKYFAGLCLNKHNILHPKSILIRKNDDLSKVNNLSLPIIVKPNYEGSSIGIMSSNCCSTYDDTIKLINYLRQNYDELIAEEYIAGYEVTNILISNKNSGEILLNEPLIIGLGNQFYLNNEIFGIKEKISNVRKYMLAQQILPLALIDKIRFTSEKIINVLKLPNFVRIDYRVNGDDIYFIEANTNPAFGMTSDVGKLCKLKNIEFSRFVSIFMDSII